MNHNLQHFDGDKNTNHSYISYSELYRPGEELAHMSIFIDNSPSMEQYKELIIDVYNNEILKMIELSRIHGRSLAKQRRGEKFTSPVMCSCNLFNNKKITHNKFTPFNKLPLLTEDSYFLGDDIDILDIIRKEICSLNNACYNAQSEGYLTVVGSIIFSNGNQSLKSTKTTGDQIKTLLQEECFNKRLDSVIGMNIVCTEEVELSFFERLGFIKDENLFLISSNQINDKLYSKISVSFGFTDPIDLDDFNCDDSETRLVIL